MSVAAFIYSQKTEHGISHVTSCRALGVSQSWLYKWKDRAPTPRQQRRADLDEAIAEHFTASGGTYGSPRIARDLREEGWRISVNTVAARMAELGLVARVRRRPRSLTRQGRRPAAPDLVHRQFTAVAPDVLWCGDVTEIITDEGKLYLATVEDLFSRRLLGYAMSEHHDAALTVASVQMAVATRGGGRGDFPFGSRVGRWIQLVVATPRSCRRMLWPKEGRGRRFWLVARRCSHRDGPRSISVRSGNVSGG
ncbi:IS3 family transposase [Streptosporangium subroseum]|uniref:IS3 family transposase n=1 Tax=Streptosporangium subroseum TaxID=106412 RepID=UPI0030927ED0|nr:IS3 family transposase [Streptosporangium subroseum]